MTTVELSPERVGRITGSRIGKILGLSVYGDADSVLREMVRQQHGAPEEFTGNWATERGNELEADALRVYEMRFSVMVWGGQRFIRHPSIPWLGVTLDGRVGMDGIVEAKVPPPNARYTRVDERPDYEAQVRLEMACARVPWGDLAVYKPDRAWPDDLQPERLYRTRVLHDDAWLVSVLPILEGFHAKYERIVASDKLSAPFLTDLGKDDVDPFFGQAEVEYGEALAALNAAKAEVAMRHEQLVQQAKGKTTRGRYFQVTYANRTGSVDYKAAVADLAPGADLEKYRKDGTEVVSVNPVGARKK